MEFGGQVGADDILDADFRGFGFALLFGLELAGGFLLELQERRHGGCWGVDCRFNEQRDAELDVEAKVLYLK